MTLIWIGLGGALGAILRFLSVQTALRLMGPGFPWGTIFVNVAGSLLMGLAAALIVERTGAGRASYFLMAGCLGGFTTFSAFSLDAMALLESGRLGAAFGYIAGSVLFSILALFAGLWLGRGLA